MHRFSAAQESRPPTKAHYSTQQFRMGYERRALCRDEVTRQAVSGKLSRRSQLSYAVMKLQGKPIPNCVDAGVTVVTPCNFREPAIQRLPLKVAR